MRTQPSSRSPYLASWGNVDTVNSQCWWGCLCLCHGQAAGIVTTCGASAGDTRGVLQELTPDESGLAVDSCSKRVGAGSGEGDGCLLEHVVSEIPNVGSSLAPVRQLGWWGAAAAAWTGGEQACSELPRRLLFLHCGPGMSGSKC